MPVLASRQSSSSSSNIPASSPSFTLSRDAPAADFVLVAFVAIGLLIAFIGASYLVLGSLGVTEWLCSHLQLFGNRIKRESENEARRATAAATDLEYTTKGTDTPTTATFSPAASPKALEMKFHNNSYVQKDPSSECPSMTVVSDCGHPTLPIAALPRAPPPAVTQPPVNSNDGNGSPRELAHKPTGNTKLLFAHRFSLLRVRNDSARPNEVSNNSNYHNDVEGHVTRPLRSSMSSPSSLDTNFAGISSPSPRTLCPSFKFPTLRGRSRATPRPLTPSVIQQAADSVVGAHPNPYDISVITPMPAVVQLLESPDVGRNFQFDFPWVPQDMPFGMVEATRVHSNSTNSLNHSEKTVLSSSMSEKPQPTPPMPQLPRNVFGDVISTTFTFPDKYPNISNGGSDTGAGAGEYYTLSPPPAPFLMDNGKYPKTASQTNLSTATSGSTVEGSPRLDDLLGLSGVSLNKTIIKQGSTKKRSGLRDLKLSSSARIKTTAAGGKENVAPDPGSPQVALKVAGGTSSGVRGKPADGVEPATRIQRPVLGVKL